MKRNAAGLWRDERHSPAVQSDFFYEGGLIAFVEWLDRGKTPVFTPPINIGVRAAKSDDDIRVELAL